jgi:predicted nucleic acid-binding protein
MIVILDSSILIGLGGIGRLALLHDLFGEVIIPQAVASEVVDYGHDAETSRLVTEAPWIHPLDLGEAEVIVLTQELNADLAGVDERLAREKLESLGVKVVGTLGILLRAKRVGLLDEIRPEIDKLRRTKFAMSQSLVETVLDMAGEYAG